jgi:hypothetical protein
MAMYYFSRPTVKFWNAILENPPFPALTPSELFSLVLHSFKKLSMASIVEAVRVNRLEVDTPFVNDPDPHVDENYLWGLTQNFLTVDPEGRAEFSHLSVVDYPQSLQEHEMGRKFTLSDCHSEITNICIHFLRTKSNWQENDVLSSFNAYAYRYCFHNLAVAIRFSTSESCEVMNVALRHLIGEEGKESREF